MNHIVDNCYSCVEDLGGLCFCDECSCGEIHDCIFCVSMGRSSDEVREYIDTYCLRCEETVHQWSDQAKCECGGLLFLKYRGDEINTYIDRYCNRCNKVLETKCDSNTKLEQERE